MSSSYYFALLFSIGAFIVSLMSWAYWIGKRAGLREAMRMLQMIGRR